MVSTDPNDPNFGLETDQSSPNFGLPAQEEPSGVGQFAKGVGQSVIEAVKGFIPTSPLKLAELATPAVGAIEEIGQTGRNLYDVAFGGKSISEVSPQEKSYPEFTAQDWGKFAGGLGINLGMAALLHKGVGKPLLKEIVSGETPKAMPQIPEPLATDIAKQQTETIPVQPVEEVIPNAEQIQGATRPDVNVQLPGGEGAREVSGGEMPADVGGEGVPPRGQGEALQQAPQEVAGETVASVPVMITKRMEADLRTRGFTDEEINAMTPQQAHENLAAVPQPEQPRLEISKEDVGSALDRTYGRDEKIRLETINDLWDEPHMQSYKDNANNLLNEVTEKMKGAPFDQAELKRRILQSEALMEGKPEDAWPMPVYVAEAGDRNTIGLLLKKDGKFEMFEGNDEATPATLDLVNKLLGNEGKTVTVYTSQPDEVIARIKEGDIPEGIFVSPSRAYAESYWGEGRDVTKVKIPLSQIAQHSEVDWQVRPKPSPQTPAVTEPTTAQPLPQESVVPPPVETPAVSTSDNPPVSRFANRFVEERVKSGEIGEIAPGQGISTPELVQRGLQMPPERVNEAVSRIAQGGDIPVDDAAAIRGEEARLSQRSAELSKVADANPNDVNAKLAADNAFKDLTDFHNGPVAQLKQNWHQQGKLMQGEIPVDLTTTNGLREQWLRDVGEMPPSKMEPVFRQTAEKVSKSIAEDNGSRANLRDAIDKATSKRKLPTVEEVQNNIMERMKVPPCPV